GPAAVHADELTHDREADTAPGDRLLEIARQSLERLEDALALRLGNAGSLVVHPDACSVVEERSPDRDALPGRAVLERVVHQVDHDLPQRIPVDRYDDVLLQLEAHVSRLRPAQLGEAVGDLPDLVGERRRLWRYAHAPLRTAPEREHVLDERGQATRLLVDDLQGATPLDVAAHPP